MRYFTSDTHFHHDNIFRFECGDLFSSHKERNETIFKIWKTKIHKDDEVWVLGDFGELNNKECEIFKALPGKKCLVMGNHDRKKPEYYKERYGFDFVSPVPVFLTKRIVLSHIPIPAENGTLNIHGHIHKGYLSLDNHINANMHVNNYQFLSDKDINRFLCTTPRNSYQFMHEWYAEHYIFTTERDDIIYNDDGSINLEESIRIIDKRKEELRKANQAALEANNEK